MSNENTSKDKKGLAIKIIIPVLLVCVVGGIWAVKNKQRDIIPDVVDKSSISETQESSTTPTNKQSLNVTTQGSSITPTDNPDTRESKGTASTNKLTETTPNKQINAETKSPSPTPTDKPIAAKSNSVDFDLHVIEKIDLEKLKSYGIPVVIDFGADSCIPCKQMAPVLKELNAELKGKAIIKFVDVWKYQSFAEGYPISVIPTQIFIDSNGKPYMPKDAEAMQMQMYTSKATGEHIFTAHQGGMTKEQLLSALKEMGLK